LLLEVDASTPGSEAIKAVIHNLSETGVLLQTTANLTKGELIEVDFPYGGVRTAAVVWSGEQLFGCSFTKDLSPAIVSATVLRAPFEIPRSNSDVASRSDLENDVSGEMLSLRARFWTIMTLALLSWAAIAAFVVWTVS